MPPQLFSPQREFWDSFHFSLILSLQFSKTGLVELVEFSPASHNCDSESETDPSGLANANVRVFKILAHYPAWITTVNGKDKNLQLDTVCNDPKVLLKALGCQYWMVSRSAQERYAHSYDRFTSGPLPDAHGDTSRRWYFVTDFEVDHKDINGVVKSLPRAVYPGTETPVLPTKGGILGILREASAGGGSGFIHCGVHCMYTTAGTSHITLVEPTGEVRYAQTPNGPSIKEAFIVTIDGERLYGWEFIDALGDGTDERCGTTLTVSLDMCNATAFLAGVVGMTYQYRNPDFGESNESPSGEGVTTTRSTNQLVVISASQPGQPAGTCNDYGAMTYFLSTALISEAHRVEGLSAADVIRFIHGKCEARKEEHLRQTPQITARYPLTGRFWLLPDPHSML
ncbi:hypothetical protein FRC04_001436 [Tulasnella sp. 424]|nr:hypothetical protein FRC04_001436 [Tulasnella sp. 424]